MATVEYITPQSQSVRTSGRLTATNSESVPRRSAPATTPEPPSPVDRSRGRILKRTAVYVTSVAFGIGVPAGASYTILHKTSAERAVAGIVIPPQAEKPAEEPAEKQGKESPALPSFTEDMKIPREHRAIYLKTEKKFQQVMWPVLAGVMYIETKHGRAKLPGVKSGVNKFGCCSGIAQFFTNEKMWVKMGYKLPTTWGSYGKDYSGDGKINVYDPADAIPAAAAYLTILKFGSNKPPKKDLCPKKDFPLGTVQQKNALRGYNNLCSYGQKVLLMAKLYATKGGQVYSR